jgi:ribonucleoside-diphosphate reductase alpha chain
MSGIGNPYQTLSLSNCFVVAPPYDSYGGICLTDQHIVQISKRRGGIGYDISQLRPKGLMVKNAARTTSGAISFMHRFSNSGREVGQGGRRGAQMITISVHHPDILDFIKVKNDEVSVTGANISVRLTDEFLKAVKENKNYDQRWTSLDGKINISGMASAREVWKEIIHSAWLRAEPGILFWDNILTGPADCYEEFRSSSTNPCSEIPLSEYDSCRLIAINLFSYVKNPFEKTAYFDYKEFYHDAQIAQRLMDDLVDLEIEKVNEIINKIKNDPEPIEVKRTEIELWTKIKGAAEGGRRTGLGITAMGDTLAALGLKYGSNKSIKEVEEIYRTLKFGAYRASIDMAKELGAFPAWDAKKEKDNEFLNRFKDEVILLEEPTIRGYDIWSDMQKYGRRNIALLTTAPTGTLSLLALILSYFGTSSGIESVYKLDFIRRKKINHDDKNVKIDFIDKVGDKWTNFNVFHAGFQAWMDITGKTKVEDSPYFGALAEEINWTQRVKLQAAAQKHICHAISSTINLPENVTEEEVAKIYETAWESGCKGITVYRNNCRTGVLIDKEEVKDKKRPKELPCDVHHITVKGKPYFCLVGLSNGIPYEVFAGKNGHLDKKIKSGKIIKVKRAYKAVFDDETEINPINMSCDDT